MVKLLIIIASCFCLLWAKAGSADVTEKSPFIAIGKAATAPVIDGRLNDKCWSECIEISPFMLKHARMNPYEMTHAYACWDFKKIYIAFKCYENNLNPDYGLTHKVIARSKIRDDKSLWKDDCVELFIRPNVTSRNYFHIIVNTINNIYDSSLLQGVKWDSNAEVKVSKNKKFWVVEMSLPFSSFGKNTISEGTEWLVNFCREQKSFAEDSCWSPTFGSFLNVEHLGRMVFRENSTKIILPKTFEKLTPGENTLNLSARARRNGAVNVTTNIVFTNGKRFSKSKKYQLKADKTVQIKHKFSLDNAQLNSPQNTSFKFNYQLADCADGKLLYQSAGFIQSTEKYSPLKTDVFLYNKQKDLYLARDSAHIVRMDIRRAKNLSGSEINNLELQMKLPSFIEIVNPLKGKRDHRSNPPLSFSKEKIKINSIPYNLYKMKFSTDILCEIGRKSKESNQILLMLHTLKKAAKDKNYSIYFQASAQIDGKVGREPERRINIRVMKAAIGKKPEKIVILEWSTGMTRQLHWLTEKEKSLMFYNWKTAGFNVKALHEFGLVLYPAGERAQIRKYGIKIMRGLPTNSQNIFDRKYINMFWGQTNI